MNAKDCSPSFDAVSLPFTNLVNKIEKHRLSATAFEFGIHQFDVQRPVKSVLNFFARPEYLEKKHQRLNGDVKVGRVDDAEDGLKVLLDLIVDASDARRISCAFAFCSERESTIDAEQQRREHL